MDFETYVNLAKLKHNISSNNQVAKVVGISGASISNFIQKRSTPSPETTLKVAKLAGCDEKEVVLDLLIDRFKEYKDVSNVLKDIKNLTTGK